MKSSRPSNLPFRLVNGRVVVEFVGRMIGGLFSNLGEMVRKGIPGGLTLDDLIQAHPFHTAIAKQWPAPIGSVWVVPSDGPIPPDFILDHMLKAAKAGQGILLLATDSSARHTARQFILSKFAR
jgi:hypothetical protein